MSSSTSESELAISGRVFVVSDSSLIVKELLVDANTFLSRVDHPLLHNFRIEYEADHIWQELYLGEEYHWLWHLARYYLYPPLCIAHKF